MSDFLEPPLDRIDSKNDGNIRLVTFNINGFRTVFHYHPWTKLRTLNNMFSSMKADIVSLQELKLTTKDVDNTVGKLNGYYSFITVPSQKKGYSGVGVYVRIPQDDEPTSIKNSLKVVKAEEGLTGVLISPDSKKRYVDTFDSIGGYPNLDLETSSKIDSEGRSIVLEFANNVVVISVYCPANSMGTEDGEQFRIQFIEALFARIRNLKKMGKHVALMGDINISRDLIDSAEGLNQYQQDGLLVSTKNEEDFERVNRKAVLKFIRSSIPKILLNEILLDSMDQDSKTDRVLVDTTRKIQSRKRSLYTVWNTIRNSRPGNYGSRIDLVLATEELANQCSNSNIWPFLMGSDHCPVFSDFDVRIFDNIELDLTSVPIPRLEARYAYKLSSQSLDMMFARIKRKDSPSPSNDGSDTRSSTPESSHDVKKRKVEASTLKKPSLKASGNRPSLISNFFKPATKPEPLVQNVTKVDAISSSQESSSQTKFSQEKSSEDKPKSKLQLTNGRFLLPTENIPKCKHNEPCILKTARTSENKGKKFWTCGKSAGTITCPEDEGKFSCNFFQWK